MGPRVLPAASPRPGGQPHPTRQRAAQGLGLGSQGCCDQVPRVSRHQTAFAHSSGGKEPQAKVSSGLVPPEALKDLALVLPERLAALATLGPRRLARAPPPSAPAFTGLPRSVRVCVSPAPDGSAGHCSRDPPHANAVTSAKAPLRRRPRSEALAGAALGGTLCQPARTRAPGWGEPGRGVSEARPCSRGRWAPSSRSPLQLLAPPSLPAPGRRRVLPPRLLAALPRPAAEPPACASICPVSFGSSFGFAWLMPR